MVSQRRPADPRELWRFRACKRAERRWDVRHGDAMDPADVVAEPAVGRLSRGRKDRERGGEDVGLQVHHANIPTRATHAYGILRVVFTAAQLIWLPLDHCPGRAEPVKSTFGVSSA